MKPPSPEAMRLAALVLANEDFESSTGAQLRIVHDWLNAQADAAELREDCRRAGVSVADVKRRMREWTVQSRRSAGIAERQS